MATEALLRFAEELKNLREEKKITLQQISSKTKIDIKFLHAIEEANFDILPVLYIRAFIKEYAQTLSLNPDEIIRKFDSSKSGEVETKPKEVIAVEQVSPKEEISIQEPARKEFDSTAGEVVARNNENVEQKNSFSSNYIIGGAIIIVAVIAFYFSFFYESGPDIIADKVEDISEETAPRYEVNKPDTSKPMENIISKPFDDSLHLSVSTSESVWIKVLSDGKNVHQKVVLKDSKLEFKAKERFSISVGNAGVVKIFFNNKEVPNVGKYGEIRNIVITKDQTRYTTVPRNEKKPSTEN